MNRLTQLFDAFWACPLGVKLRQVLDEDKRRWVRYHCYMMEGKVKKMEKVSLHLRNYHNQTQLHMIRGLLEDIQ